LTRQRTEPTDEGRDQLIHRLAIQLNVTPSTELIDLARTSWIEATEQWRRGRGPKPDAAKCVSSAAAAISRQTSG